MKTTPNKSTPPNGTPIPEAERAAAIAALQSVSDWPALIAKRQRVAKRIKPYLTADASHHLYLAWMGYSAAAGMNVSQSLLVRRAIDLLAERAVAMTHDAAVREAEVDAIRGARSGRLGDGR